MYTCISGFIFYRKMDYMMSSFYNREGKAEHSSATRDVVRPSQVFARARGGITTRVAGARGRRRLHEERGELGGAAGATTTPRVVARGMSHRATMSRLARPRS
jgi:hypothetical protein